MNKREFIDNGGSVAEFYREHHTKQTLEWASRMTKNCEFGEVLGIQELCEYGDQIIDPSDPDIHLSQLHHAIQTAEAARTKLPGKKYEWFHLTAFLHDLGKGPLAKHLAIQNNTTVPNILWSVVGDTLPLGCAPSKHNVYAELFSGNPDNGKFDKLGIYSAGCGFDQVIFSFGHDEYTAQALERSRTELPQLAIDIVRYHSFYPWHQYSAYQRFANEKDLEVREWLQTFQVCDLYSKQDIPVDPARFMPYYQELADKYIPKGLHF